MKEKDLLKQLNELELDQLLKAYNVICTIITKNAGEKRFSIKMLGDALAAQQLVLKEMIRKKDEKE